MCQQSHNKCIEVTHWLKKHVCILREFLTRYCTKLPNLEMEPKCLMKNDVQLIPDILRTKNDKRILPQGDSNLTVLPYKCDPWT